MSDILYKLEKHFTTITLNTGENIRGYVIKNSGNHVLIHLVEDFHLDGFVVVSKWFIQNVFHGKQEKFREDAFQKIGLERKVKYNIKFDIQDYQTIFSQLENKLIIIEKFYKQSERFYGKIIKYKDCMIEFQQIDSYGKILKTIKKLNQGQISNICFDSEYINMFEKYCIK